jgi:hypothetical protein
MPAQQVGLAPYSHAGPCGALAGGHSMHSTRVCLHNVAAAALWARNQHQVLASTCRTQDVMTPHQSTAQLDDKRVMTQRVMTAPDGAV